MKLLARKPGSSLLLTLLIMIGVSGVLLTVTKSVVSQVRLSGQTRLSQEATQASLAGINDGLLRINRGLLVGAEYGEILGPNNLGPLRVGFNGSACDTVTIVSSPRTSLYDPKCPFYDMTVRTKVSVGAANQMVLTNLDIPLLNRTENFDIVSNPGSVQLVAHFVDINTGSITCNAGCVSTGPFGDGTSMLINGNLPTTLSLTITAGALNAQGITLVNSTSPDFTIQKKDSYLVQATGYSGGIQKKYLLFRNKTTNKQQLIDFTGTISEKGVITF